MKIFSWIRFEVFFSWWYYGVKEERMEAYYDTCMLPKMHYL